MTKSIHIGTRGSPLALWQAEWARDRLRVLHPEVSIELTIIETTGDKNLASSLSMIGSRGIFTREIERALLDRRVDVAVHSLKDLPTILPDGLAIAAICEREDPRDALVTKSARSIADLPKGATVVTGSLRRRAQLLKLRPDLCIADIRGNVGTRLRKFDESDWDAIVFARAGLLRLGLESRIACTLEPAEMLPAVAQGALALQTRTDDEETAQFVRSLDYRETRIAATAERAFLHRVEGGCQVPVGALAAVEGSSLRLDGLVASLDGTMCLRDSVTGTVADPESAGRELADRLLDAGGRQILEAIRNG